MKFTTICSLAFVACGLVLGGHAQADSVEDKYKKSCHICHDTGVANAPKVHDVEAWKPRLDKGMDTLVNSIKNGLNAMPPGGMCADCSDEDYKALIEFMSKPKQ
ncbi:c-type cytochrome [Microbulbifer agarilyticus]|uniref:c-type cytochrome n=1 Tax=Microbulbifer agarilyticus TaxID=260552 RepID=UPI001C97A2DA|nr:c-type cytochrome [Microbulbifer agarilyticus]MBY6191591.1 c-type cytochrome [Microbulbifer agarilyticus]MBY6212500.1 c-type cytochrome [Microbulbifer agarilyticus]